MLLGLALATASCTSGGSAAGPGAGGAGGGGGGGAGGGGGGPATGLVWEDDGVAQAADYVVATRVHDARFDFLEVSGTQFAGNNGLVLSVSIPPPGLLAAGSTHPCNPDATAAALFSYSTVTGATATSSCTILVTEPGTPGGSHAVGTFEAIVTPSAGGTKTIGRGRFDVAVTAPRN